MWNSSLRREVETVWPGINEVQITAARTGAWAGMDEPKWGPDITREFTGRKKDKSGNWQEVKATVTFPEWCEVTVYRVVSGIRCAFTEPVYWTEAYSRSGGGELPTDMWIKRPRGQLHKVAKAASLRAAFPEEGEYTAEEMEGKDIEHGGVVIEAEPVQPRKRTREEISANAARKRQEMNDRVPNDLAQITSLAELERYKREVLTPEFMSGLGTGQYAVEEFVARREEELRGDVIEDEAVDPETGEIGEAEPIQSVEFIECRDYLSAAADLADLKSRAKNNGYVEALKGLTEEQRKTLRTLYAEKQEQFRSAIIRDVSGREMSVLEAG
jgi:hypothetical protein